ncbi:MAG TPA: hypothetical protein VJ579_04530 [Candidatus Paceibacterota bacterium]|nr:hypothetical protein [Candidatus Paceibacterota bacterium]
MRIETAQEFTMLEILTLGEVTITPNILGFLKKATYCLTFERLGGKMTLYGNDGGPTEILLTATNVHPETARQLASMLGLPPRESSAPIKLWGIKVHFFRLHFDDSDAARALYAALVENKVPHEVIYHAPELSLHYDGKKYSTKQTSLTQMLLLIKAAITETKHPVEPEKQFIIS